MRGLNEIKREYMGYQQRLFDWDGKSKPFVEWRDNNGSGYGYGDYPTVCVLSTSRTPIALGGKCVSKNLTPEQQENVERLLIKRAQRMIKQWRNYSDDEKHLCWMVKYNLI
jgi:hypothetical protein